MNILKTVLSPVNWYIGTLSAAGRTRFLEVLIWLALTSPIWGLIIVSAVIYSVYF